MRRPAPLLALLFALALPPAAIAETVEVSGADGAHGADGGSDAPGSDGQAGEAATARADDPGEDVVARAVGGAGGDGGDGSPNGAGGDGGDATAEAIGVDALLVEATAQGGDGGEAGRLLGSPTPPQPDDGGGASGAATALATLQTDTSERVTGRIEAVGGRAQDGGRAGSATATAHLENEGTGLLDGSVTARGGSASSSGGDGGDARAEAQAVGAGDVTLTLVARGGLAGDGAGDTNSGGDAEAIASAVSTGSGDVFVRAEAEGALQFRNEPRDGSAHAEAFGSSQGGDVHVEAIERSEVDAIIRDAVSGSTSGLLTLRQILEAKSATASLDATNPGGGDLSVEVRARASGPGDAVVESVEATAEGSVDVRAEAYGGPYSEARIGSVVGRSTGDGAVSARASASRSAQQDRRGTDISLVDVVSAETSGPIVLEQFAQTSQTASTPGTALSRLDVDETAESLRILSEASGGIAEAHSASSNAGGSLHVDARADGVQEANASAEATTHGDGQKVSVGTSNVASASADRAQSRSEATALGDSLVEVYDRVEGRELSSSATGSNQGASAVTVRSVARHEVGGSSAISAHGHSGGGGAVLVVGDVQGPGARIDDGGLSGSSSGLVRLEAKVDGQTGPAHVSIDQANAGGGDLEIRVDIASRDVLTAGPVRGVADTGADVSVQLYASQLSSQPLALIGVVDGETSGTLELLQSARGSGAMRSELGKVSDSESLRVQTQADSFSTGSEALASSSARNLSGDARSDADSTSYVSATSRSDATSTLGDAVAFSSAAGQSSTASAVAEATSSAEGDGRAIASAEALGSSSVAARADATGVGSGDVSASARAARQSGQAPTELSAEGTSLGGGDVRVSAALNAGGSVHDDVELFDAVRGSTSGRLSLEQRVSQGLRGSGSATTGLQATNPGGGDLAMLAVASARGEGDAVLRDVVGTSTTGADVDVRASAIGNRARMQKPADDGSGDLVPSRVYGESNGGDVHVAVSLFHTGSEENGLDGLSIALENVPDGSTPGALSLAQTAGAATGRSANPFDPSSQAGSGGDARSVLSRDTEVAALTLHARAKAGSGGSGSPAQQGAPGFAEAISHARNTGGSATARASADGALGAPESFLFDGPGGVGGDARAEMRAETTGDGHAVVVGAEIDENPFLGTFFAVAGATGGSAGGGRSGQLARGGDAHSTSTGIAAGDSQVTVNDVAIGGRGGRAPSFFVADATAGDGGSALSEAFAQGGGASTVRSKADARGGLAGDGTLTPGEGGAATALAEGTGAGRVEAWAHALGGSSLVGPRGGAAGRGGVGFARATAEGASGFARAEALSGAGTLAQVRAQSEAAVGSRSDTAAFAASGAALSSASFEPGLEGLAFLTNDPTAGDREHALAQNAGAAQRFADAPGSDWQALGRWQAAGRDAGEGLLSLATELEVVLGDVDPADELAFAVFDIELEGDGFEGLSFALERNGSALGAMEHFETLDDALAFFRDAVFDFGAGLERGDSLLARFQLELAPEASFAMNAGFARIVPEPGTGALVALGLAGLAARRRAKPRR